MKADLNSSKVYIPETWKERVAVKFTGVLWNSLEEGSPLPRWFIPVRHEPNRYTVELWILPLAPFVWFYYMISDVFWCVWSDMFKWKNLVGEWKSKKNPIERTKE